MQLGMIGLGRVGANMALRLLRAGHDVHVCGRRPDPVQVLVSHRAKGSTGLAVLIQGLAAPRAAWPILPTAVVRWGQATRMPAPSCCGRDARSILRAP